MEAIEFHLPQLKSTTLFPKSHLVGPSGNGEPTAVQVRAGSTDGLVTGGKEQLRTIAA